MGYRNAAHVQPGVRPIRFRTLFVNKSYRRYAVCRTTSVVAYVRQTIVNSHPGHCFLGPKWPGTEVDVIHGLLYGWFMICTDHMPIVRPTKIRCHCQHCTQYRYKAGFPKRLCEGIWQSCKVHLNRHRPISESMVRKCMSILSKLCTFSKNLPEQYTNRLKDVSEIGKHQRKLYKLTHIHHHDSLFPNVKSQLHVRCTRLCIFSFNN